MARLSASATHATRRSASSTTLLPRAAEAKEGSGTGSDEEPSELQPAALAARTANATAPIRAEERLRIRAREAQNRSRFRRTSPPTIFHARPKSPPPHETNRLVASPEMV